MAFWNSSQILTIADGTIANDGTGDPIRTAFAKVNENFSNVAIQLSQVNQDWYNANVAFNTNLNGTTNISNLFVANATGTIGTFTGNLTANTLVAKAALYVSGVARVNGNLYMGGNIIPTTGGMYNLGTPTMPFANLYVQSTISTTQINSSSDAGLLLIHANASPGDSKDVGIFGNIASDYGNANTYAFFGHQYTTNNFVYKITNTNAVLGNNVVYDGIYGNAQLGSMFLSNSTISTSTATGTLVVGGGIGAGGNLYIGGNAYAGGFRILTTDSPGMGSFSGTTISNLAVTSIAQSISPVTGALIVNFGGLGVAGNIYSGGNVVAAALVGPYYGQIQTAAQPNVTSVGTLNSLQVGTSIGTSSITVSGSGVAAGFAPLVVAQGGANVTGGFNSFGTIASTGNVTAPFFIGNVSSPQLNTVNANVAAANIAIAAVTTAVVSYVNSLNTAMIANVNAANVSASLLNTAMIANVNAANVSASLLNTAMNANVNAANVSASLLNTAMNANVVAANAAIVTANSAVVGYVNTLNSAMIANVNATNTAIVTANTAVVSYVNTLNGAMVTYVNSSNSSMKTYVDATAATLTSNAATLAASINSLATNSNASVAAYLQRYTGTFGTLSSLTVSGAVTVGSGITNGGSSGSGNIGSATTSFNTVFAKATSAQYADLAENYIADLDYVPGTVVVFGGDKEITVTSVIADARVAGAISTNPAYLMNDTAPGLPVALRGRIPVMVSGPVTKGDSLVTSAIPGYAMSVGCDTTYGQAVFAKALETDLTDGLKVIEAVIL